MTGAVRPVGGLAADGDRCLVRRPGDLFYGIEMSAQRVALGKPSAGRISLVAQCKDGTLHMEVRDDGAGLSRPELLRAARAQGIETPQDMGDQKLWSLVFAPGLTTATTITDVSGRGVGMDAVRRKMAALGGEVWIESSAGVGTCVTLLFMAGIESAAR